MEPFVYAPASMLGNWTNVIFFKFLKLYYQMLPKKHKWSLLYTLQQACLVTGQTLSSLSS